MSAKFVIAEMMFINHFEHRLTPWFDLILFEHDFFVPERLSSILRAVGLNGNLSRGYALPGFDQGGNFRGPILAPILYPQYCFAVGAARSLSPRLYAHFHPNHEMCANSVPARARTECLMSINVSHDPGVS